MRVAKGCPKTESTGDVYIAGPCQQTFLFSVQ
jgi:hypothetical protein